MSVKTIVCLLAIGLIAVNSAPTTPSCLLKCEDTGECLSPFWKCDNVKDCADGSDEKNCAYLHDCGKDEFMCLNGECVKATYKCNGVADCSDLSDERGCDFKLDRDLPSLEDYEHEMGHLEVSTTSVPLTTMKPLVRKGQCPTRNATLYFTNNDVSVFKLNLSDPSQQAEQLFAGRGEDKDFISSLSYMRDVRELLFSTKRFDNRIQAANAYGKVRDYANHASKHFGRVAVDPLTENVYFTEDGYGIGVCDKKAANCVTLIKADSHTQTFRDLSLHPIRGTMFWIQDEASSPVIKIAGMDGRDPRQLSAFGWVYAIALDAENEQLYVAEENSIVRVNLRTLSQVEYAQVRASSMSFFNCDLLYVQRDVPSLHLINSRLEDTSISMLGGSSFVLAVVPEVDRDAYNPCSSVSCPELCVLTESSIIPETRCMCSVCGENTILKADSSTLNWVITAVLFSLLISLIVMFLVIYFRLWPALCDRLDALLGFNAHNASNISVGFNNSELH